jgi:hypothetical protein
MNNSLLMLIRKEADLVPFTSEDCVFDPAEMRNHISTARVRTFLRENKEAKSEGDLANVLADPQAPHAPHPEPHLNGPATVAPSPAAAPVAASATNTSLSEAVAPLKKTLDVLTEKIDVLIPDIADIANRVHQSIRAMSQLSEDLQSQSRTLANHSLLPDSFATIKEKESAFSMSGCCRVAPLTPRSRMNMTAVPSKTGSGYQSQAASGYHTPAFAS